MKVYCVFYNDHGVSDHDRLEAIFSSYSDALDYISFQENHFGDWLYIEAREVQCSD